MFISNKVSFDPPLFSYYVDLLLYKIGCLSEPSRALMNKITRNDGKVF